MRLIWVLDVYYLLRFVSPFAVVGYIVWFTEVIVRVCLAGVWFGSLDVYGGLSGWVVAFVFAGLFWYLLCFSLGFLAYTWFRFGFVLGDYVCLLYCWLKLVASVVFASFVWLYSGYYCMVCFYVITLRYTR